jgi:hypothetical protein
VCSVLGLLIAEATEKSLPKKQEITTLQCRVSRLWKLCGFSGEKGAEFEKQEQEGCAAHCPDDKPTVRKALTFATVMRRGADGCCLLPGMLFGATTKKALSDRVDSRDFPGGLELRSS